MTETVKRSIYIYKIKKTGVSSLDIDAIFEKFQEKNLMSNILDVDGEEYVFFCYKKEGNLIGGIFLKRKELSQVIINKSIVNSFLSWFKFEKNQEPAEPSHLVWDFENNVILSEMNWSGARHLNGKFGKYLSKILRGEIQILPILNEESYKLYFLRNKILKRVTLTVPKPHVNILYNTMGIDVRNMKQYIDNNDDCEIQVSVLCKRYKKGLRLIPQSIITLYNKIINSGARGDLNLYVQDNNQTTLSLLDGALIKDSFDLDVDSEKKIINRDDFYNKIKNYWLAKKDEVMNLLQHA